MALRVLIAEDDEDVALYLKQIIEEVPDVTVVNIAKNGKEAIENIEILEPAAVFLDIDMPGLDGLTVAREALELIPDINIVFATAHPDFALEAFELYSFDYILKPFDPKRIHKTLQKIKEKMRSEPVGNRIVIQTDNSRIFVNTSEILFIEGIGHQLTIKTEKGLYTTRGDLAQLETRLDPDTFFRTHKGYIVNLKKVTEIVPSYRTFEMVLNSGDRVLLSREREKLLKQKYLVR